MGKRNERGEDTMQTASELLREICEPSPTEAASAAASSAASVPRLPPLLLPLLQQLLEPVCLRVDELHRMPTGLVKQVLLTALHRLPKEHQARMIQEADPLAQMMCDLLRTA